MLAIAFAVVGRWLPASMRERADAFVARPAMPLLAGFITAGLVLTFWGSLTGPGVFHDERAYLVQARLLAAFTWTAPTPPLPEFWEMAHMFVVPALFAKYPPGHAPLLVPGIWLGMPGLVPVLLSGLAGALVFLLGRRVAGAWTAVAAWALWTSSPFVLLWQSSYFSEVTTAALWLLALLALLEWTRHGRGGSLVAIVASVGWLGITRPVTGIALGLPIAIVVLRTAWKRRSLSGWKPALFVGAVIVAFVPWWAWRTIGSPTLMPYSHYSRVYFPWDMPGFERDTSPPLRWLPPDLVALGESTKINYEGHTAARMWPNFLQRSGYAVVSSVPFEARWLTAFAPIGLLALGAPVAIVLASSFALLIGAYLVMPHHVTWSVYYLEVFPVPALLAMAGLAFLVRLAVRALRRRRAGSVDSAAYRATSLGDARADLPRSIALAVLVLVAWRVVPNIPTGRVADDPLVNRILVLEARLDRLPERRIVLFIRPDRRVQPHYTLHDILGDPATTDRWMVRDLGAARNAQLIALADGRTPYLFDEFRHALVKLGPDGQPADEPTPLVLDSAAAPATADATVPPAP